MPERLAEIQKRLKEATRGPFISGDDADMFYLLARLAKAEEVCRAAMTAIIIGNPEPTFPIETHDKLEEAINAWITWQQTQREGA